MTVVSLDMAYRSFRGGSGRLDTRLDTPPISHRHHPVSRIAPATMEDRGSMAATTGDRATTAATTGRITAPTTDRIIGPTTRAITRITGRTIDPTTVLTGAGGLANATTPPRRRSSSGPRGSWYCPPGCCSGH